MEINQDEDITAKPIEDEIVNNLFDSFMDEQQPDQDQNIVNMAQASQGINDDSGDQDNKETENDNEGYSSDEEVITYRISDLNLHEFSNNLDNEEEMDNSDNNAEDSNNDKDSEKESDDSRINFQSARSRFNKSTLEDSDEDVKQTIELPKVKRPYNLQCKECKTHRHTEECSNHP